jgi:hypothetical protein
VCVYSMCVCVCMGECVCLSTTCVCVSTPCVCVSTTRVCVYVCMCVCMCACMCVYLLHVCECNPSQHKINWRLPPSLQFVLLPRTGVFFLSLSLSLTHHIKVSPTKIFKFNSKRTFTLYSNSSVSRDIKTQYTTSLSC